MKRMMRSILVLVLAVVFCSGCDFIMVDPYSCTYDEQCGDGHYCDLDSYTCFLVAWEFGGPNWCFEDSQCGPGYVCNPRDNFCYREGDVGYHPEDQNYFTGWDESTGQCKNQGHCRPNEICANGWCVLPAGSHNGNQPGYYDNDGRCQNHQQCASDEVCANGWCTEAHW